MNITRLRACLVLEVTHQMRQGFYAATAVLLVVWAAFLRALPEGAGLLLPAFLLGNITLTAFYFAGGLVLLEKDQGVLPGLGVSPLRGLEYVAAKAISLGSIVLIENATLITLAWAFELVEAPASAWIYWILATVLGTLLFLLPGLAMMVHYGSVNEALIPGSLVAFVLEWPSLVAFGLPEWPINYLIPSQGAWLLMRAPLQSLSIWQLLYCGIYPSLWMAVGFFLAIRAYRQLTLPH